MEPRVGAANAFDDRFAPEDDDLTVTALDQAATGGAQRTPRRRASPRTRSILVIGLALLLCLAILLNLAGGRQGLAALLQGATPASAAVVKDGNNVLYFLDGAQWGQLTLDGAALSLSQEPAPILLSAGRHTLQYLAAPFPSLRCQLTVPTDIRWDTCPLLSNVQLDGEPDDARIIDLQCAPEKLPANAYDQLILDVTSSLAKTSTSATVAPGEHYLSANGSATVATEPLRATVSLDLNLDPSRQVVDGTNDSSCVTFCSDEADANVWTFQAHVLARWSFATADGRYGPPSSAAIDTSLTLAAEWVNGAWSLASAPVSSDNLGDFCFDALNGPPGGPAPFTITGDYYNAFAQASNQADGCVEVISRSDDVNSFTVGLPTDAALFIYRFGAILAGNELAHQEQPRLAVATDQERILALQWYDSPA